MVPNSESEQPLKSFEVLGELSVTNDYREIQTNVRETTVLEKLQLVTRHRLPESSRFGHCGFLHHTFIPFVLLVRVSGRPARVAISNFPAFHFPFRLGNFGYYVIAIAIDSRSSRRI